MKKIIISAIILLFYSTITEAETKNKILYDNKVFDLCCNLLEPLYIKTGSGDWCNYGSVWEIKENTLYLLGLVNDSPAGHKKADMKELFGDKYINGKVKAEWFTGELHIPDGKLFQQNDNLCIFERDIAVSVEDGKITKSIVFDNTKKTASTGKRSLLSPVINPDKSIFGINYGTTEDEFKARFGQPTECRELEKTGREMLYGKKYIFLFKEKKLVGMYSVSFEHEVYQNVPIHDNFDNLDWKLTNSITRNMNLAEVKKILETEGLGTKLAISNLPEKDLNIAQKILNLPIEAVKNVIKAVSPSKSGDNDQRKLANETQPKLSFSTEKALIELSLRHEDKKKNINEAYTISEILIRLK